MNKNDSSQRMSKGVQQLAQPNTKETNLRFADVRYFVAAADSSSFKGAAARLKCSLNTVRSHVDQLEKTIGNALFRRSFRGVELTHAGKRLLDQARGQGASASAAFDATVTVDRSLGRDLKLAITEGLGAFWMVPRIAEFQRQRPEVLVRLDCKMTLENLERSDADMAIQLERPTDPKLICVRLGTLHLMPFASCEYLRRYGQPRSVQDGLTHRFVVQIADQVRSDMFSAFVGSTPPEGLTALETNTSSSHYWAVAQGVGIGVLPTYARAITKSVIPVDMEIKLRRDIWLIYHPDIRRSQQGKEAVAWIKSAFDPKKYPWFSDEFVHPTEFETRFTDSNVVSLFSGYMEVTDEAEPSLAPFRTGATSDMGSIHAKLRAILFELDGQGESLASAKLSGVIDTLLDHNPGLFTEEGK
jgi:DNA-binding transcriptional LysR family regulator